MKTVRVFTLILSLAVLTGALQCTSIKRRTASRAIRPVETIYRAIPATADEVAAFKRKTRSAWLQAEIPDKKQAGSKKGRWKAEFHAHDLDIFDPGPADLFPTGLDIRITRELGPNASFYIGGTAGWSEGSCLGGYLGLDAKF